MAKCSAERVADAVLATMAGKPAGTVLPSYRAVMAAEKVATATVRDAFQFLVANGLAVEVGERYFLGEAGTTPIGLNGQGCSFTIADGMFTRLALEGVVAALVAERVRDGAIDVRDQLRGIIARIDEAQQTSRLKVHEAVDSTLHGTVWSATANAMLRRIYLLHQAALEMSVKQSVRTLGRDPVYRSDTAQQHKRMLEPIIHGVPEQAREAAEAHIRYAIGRLGPRNLKRRLH